MARRNLVEGAIDVTGGGEVARQELHTVRRGPVGS